MKYKFQFLFIFGIISCSYKQPEVNDASVYIQENNESNQFDMPIVLADTTNKPKKTISFKIRPVDESKSDPSLIDFISNLKRTVNNKDKAALLKVLDSDIVVSEGGGIYGIEAFTDQWNLQNPAQSKLWEELEGILRMGGTWEVDDEGKYFSIPYTQSNKTFSKFKHNFDWFFTAVVKDSAVQVLQEPKATAKPIGTLSYDVVIEDPEFSHPIFSKIETVDRKISGYVKHTNLEHAANRKLVFAQKTQWMENNFLCSV